MPYTASVFEQTPGPVLAVGHSYGGAVIINAAARVDNVVAGADVIMSALAAVEAPGPSARTRTTPQRDAEIRGERT
jgi:predicted alpha/beta hydrolase family esterase